MDTRMRQVSVPIIFGSVSFFLGKKGTDYHSHKWTCYIRGADNEDLSHVISKVEFQLHPSFRTPLRIIEAPPFEVTETGWGEFEISILIHFSADAEERPLETTHFLKLYQDLPGGGQAPPSTKRPVINERYDEIAFNDPNDSFYERLKTHIKIPARLHDLSSYFSEFSDVEEVKKLKDARAKIASQQDKLEAEIRRVEAACKSLQGLSPSVKS